MSLIEIIEPRDEFSRQYRIGQFLTLVVAILFFLYGINARNNTLNALVQYTDIEAGISLSYPAEWLIDFDGDYIIRARDMQRMGYKTTIQITLLPIGPDITERNVLDTLNNTRARSVIGYDILSITPVTLPDETQATAMEYTFVDSGTNPFLASIPVVVRGRDILLIRGGQAIVVTFRTDALQFADEVGTLESVLSSLEY
ncbi:MAG: hypothetical protein ACOCX5_03690 [Chloroflexota bacterium]